METQNAFAGKLSEPSAEELATALGPTFLVWQKLVGSLITELTNSEQEWNSYKPKYGWSLIIKVKKRRIVYLSPTVGSFQVSLILGDKAITAARSHGFTKPLVKILDEAPHYQEGTGIRITVKNSKLLPAICTLAQIKLAN